MDNTSTRQVDELFDGLVRALDDQAEAARYAAMATRVEPDLERLLGRAEAFLAAAVLARRARIAAGGSPELPKGRLKRGLDWDDDADPFPAGDIPATEETQTQADFLARHGLGELFGKARPPGAGQ